MAVRVLAVAAVLALLPAVLRAAPADEHGAPDSAAPLPPALRGQVFARSRSTFEVRGEDDTPAWRGGSHPAGAGAGLRHDLVRGTLLRAQLNDDTDLTLRLRGGKLGLYLSVRLDSR